MTNVVSLQEVSKDETIRKLEAELQEYRDDKRISEIEDDIMLELGLLTKQFMETIALEDKAEVIKGLESYLVRLKKANE